MAAEKGKKRFPVRVRQCVPRQLNLDNRSNEMLKAICGGRVSATMRLLIAQEYGRQMALGLLKTPDSSVESQSENKAS